MFSQGEDGVVDGGELDDVGVDVVDVGGGGGEFQSHEVGRVRVKAFLQNDVGVGVEAWRESVEVGADVRGGGGVVWDGGDVDVDPHCGGGGLGFGVEEGGE